MNELIKINSLASFGDVPTVSGRELHEALEVKEKYVDWFKRMCEYGFVEGEDYYSFLSNSSFSENSEKPKKGGRPRTDHALTIDTAKEICMLQRTEIGRTIRRYFIETEKQYRQQEQKPLTIYEDKLLLFHQRQTELESRLNQLERKMDGDELTARDITTFNSLLKMFASPTAKITLYSEKEPLK